MSENPYTILLDTLDDVLSSEPSDLVRESLVRSLEQRIEDTRRDRRVRLSQHLEASMRHNWRRPKVQPRVPPAVLG